MDDKTAEHLSVIEEMGLLARTTTGSRCLLPRSDTQTLSSPNAIWRESDDTGQLRP